METKITDTRPLTCECGSEEVCVCYSAPVFVYITGERLTKVVINDQDTRFGGVVRCMACDRFWIVDEERRWASGRHGSSVSNQ